MTEVITFRLNADAARDLEMQAKKMGLSVHQAAKQIVEYHAEHLSVEQQIEVLAGTLEEIRQSDYDIEQLLKSIQDGWTKALGLLISLNMENITREHAIQWINEQIEGTD